MEKEDLKNAVRELEKEKDNKEVKNGCIGFVILVLIAIGITMCSKCSDNTDTPKNLSASDSVKMIVDTMVTKWKAKRISDINMIINKNIKLKEISDMATFKAYIINEYEAYFNMQYKYVETEIWDKSQKKFPNSFQDQDAYCSEHNCKTINYDNNSIDSRIINANDENHIDEINDIVGKLYDK